MSLQNICPKCKLKLQVDNDKYGWYQECIMCGYISDLEEPASVANNDVKNSKILYVKPPNRVAA
ncbi:MAG: hypothetical protein A2144_15015 [Chloroflexi bacterium RBG_16_50_9]|nr:MAG: hypothetical protein A2144_15015 [Chloroflexi bacterium RBG_16_50_9]